MTHDQAPHLMRAEGNEDAATRGARLALSQVDGAGAPESGRMGCTYIELNGAGQLTSLSLPSK